MCTVYCLGLRNSTASNNLETFTMKLFNSVFFTILIIGILSACHGESTHPRLDNTQCPGTVRIAVDQSPLFSDSVIARDLRLTGLEDLRRGFRDFQIRIWRQPAHTDKFQVFVLKQVNDTYQVRMYEYRYQFKGSGSIPMAVSKRVKEARAKGAWSELRERMAIAELFEQGDINDLSNDQSGATIELSTCDRYKIFFQPVYTADRQKKNAVELLLSTIEKGFSVVWLNERP